MRFDAFRLVRPGLFLRSKKWIFTALMTRTTNASICKITSVTSTLSRAWHVVIYRVEAAVEWMSRVAWRWEAALLNALKLDIFHCVEAVMPMQNVIVSWKHKTNATQNGWKKRMIAWNKKLKWEKMQNDLTSTMTSAQLVDWDLEKCWSWMKRWRCRVGCHIAFYLYVT